MENNNEKGAGLALIIIVVLLMVSVCGIDLINNGLYNIFGR